MLVGLALPLTETGEPAELFLPSACLMLLQGSQQYDTTGDELDG
jgi:hypothetical protein